MLGLLGWLGSAQAGALEDYVQRADTNYSWKKLEQRRVVDFTITHLQLVSQQWREFTWTHDLQVVRPDKVRNPAIAFMLVTGDGTGQRQVGTLQRLARDSTET